MRALCLTVLATFALTSMVAKASGLSTLISYGLKHSPRLRESRANLEVKSHAKSIAHRRQFLPQVSLDLSDQHFVYDRRFDQNGINSSNNGSDPSIGIGVGYDLQKLFESSSRLAAISLQYAEVKTRLEKRALIRDVKAGFFAIRESSAEIDLLERQIHLFDRVDSILEKQRKIGVFNEIEREQFDIQKGLLASQLSSQKMNLTTNYSKLAVLIGMDADGLKEHLEQINEDPPLVFASRAHLDVEEFEHFSQGDVLKSLQGYDLAKMAYEHFTPLPLPSVYARIHRDWPSMPSSDGPETVSEVGLAFPIDAFFTRPQEKEKLAAQKDRESAAYDKAIAEYHSAIRLSVLKIKNLKAEAGNLNRVHEQAAKLLKKSFLYYSQKRLDAMGTLDIFQKSFDASKALLINKANIETADANLEYLVGNPIP